MQGKLEANRGGDFRTCGVGQCVEIIIVQEILVDAAGPLAHPFDSSVDAVGPSSPPVI